MDEGTKVLVRKRAIGTVVLDFPDDHQVSVVFEKSEAVKVDLAYTHWIDDSMMGDVMSLFDYSEIEQVAD
jgi:hypothetical protein